jgi:hypothetical protein
LFLLQSSKIFGAIFLKPYWKWIFSGTSLETLLHAVRKHAIRLLVVPRLLFSQGKAPQDNRLLLYATTDRSAPLSSKWWRWWLVKEAWEIHTTSGSQHVRRQRAARGHTYVCTAQVSRWGARTYVRPAGGTASDPATRFDALSAVIHTSHRSHSTWTLEQVNVRVF